MFEFVLIAYISNAGIVSGRDFPPVIYETQSECEAGKKEMWKLNPAFSLLGFACVPRKLKDDR